MPPASTHPAPDPHLPSPKGVAFALMEACRRDALTTQEAARIIQADPAMSGRLIKQANSARHGGRAVASVNEAVMRLGLHNVRQLALGFSLIDQHQSGPCKGFDYPHFWSHSLLMAIAIQTLGQRLHAGVADELFACGLLARIGHLAMASLYPAEYAALLENHPAEASLVSQERQQLDTDHIELGVRLLHSWGFPKLFTDAIAHHEAPEQSPFETGSRIDTVTHLLNMAARVADLGLADELARGNLSGELLLLGSKIGLNADEVAEVVDHVMAEWQTWSTLLHVPSQAMPAFAKIEDCPIPRPLPEPGATAMRVLLVEDNASTRLLMEKLLRTQCGHSVQSAANGAEAMAIAIEFMPQVVITDWYMPEMSGLELCRTLRATDWGRDMYVLMVTSAETEDELVQAYEAGVDEFVTKPVNLRALKARLRAAWRYVKLRDEWKNDHLKLRQFAAELAMANRKLEHAALTDPLTGLFNRRAAMEFISQAWSASTRSNAPLSVMLIDIDHFKRINDQHGHATGDSVLQDIAHTLRKAARTEDPVCRVGGEEFLLICQHADLHAAKNSAERLRQAIEHLRIAHDGGELSVSISIGIAQKTDSTPSAEALMKLADKHLYTAKKQGRNRVNSGLSS